MAGPLCRIPAETKTAVLLHWSFTDMLPEMRLSGPLCRIPAETETAALGAALQGAACWSDADVAQFVAQHQQTEGQEVSRGTCTYVRMWDLKPCVMCG